MEAIGYIMFGGAILGGATQGVLDAYKGISDACNNLDQATNDYQSTKEAWKSVFQDGITNETDVTTLNQNLNTEYANYKTALKAQVDSFKKKQFIINIFNGLFIFVIILTLLFKYFKIYDKIWNLFTN